MVSKLLIGGFALCLAACASNPSTPAGATPKSAAAKQPPAGCAVNPATRFPASSSECAAFSHSWTQDDIRSTGATDVSQALRQLDPTVTINGQGTVVTAH